MRTYQRYVFLSQAEVILWEKPESLEKGCMTCLVTKKKLHVPMLGIQSSLHLGQVHEPLSQLDTCTMLVMYMTYCLCL